MSKDDRLSRDTDAPDVALPGTANRVARDRPALWEAFQRLGEEASRAGPLDDHTRRLVHLAYAIAADSEGATHSTPAARWATALGSRNSNTSRCSR